MKVCHETNLTRSHLTMFFITYKSQILVKVKSSNGKKSGIVAFNSERLKYVI